MELNLKNYHSLESNREYLSVSQFKDFCGTKGKVGCEAYALAKLRGEWVEEPSTAMLVGSYVDAYIEGSLSEFKEQNPGIFKKDGDLRAEYKKAEEIIDRIERDSFFMKTLSGEKQTILTGEIFGTKWKCKIDSFNPKSFITDLKVMKSIRETFWVKDYGKMSFCEYWGYDIQGAVYQEIVKQNFGVVLPFFIAAVSKESEPDIEVIGFTQRDLDDTVSIVGLGVNRIIQLKSGEVEPDSCGRCDYCKRNKVLTAPVHFREIFEG